MFELNTREMAIVIWLTVIFGAAILWPKTRSSLIGLLRAFFNHKILLAIAAMAAWVGLCVAVLATLKNWEWGHLKTTIVWFVTYAFVTLFDINKLAGKPGQLATLSREAVAATAVILFIAEFHTLPLWSELVLIPATTFLGALVAIAELKPETKKVAPPIQALMVIIGLGIAAHSVYQIVLDFGDFATLDTLRDFAVPVLLSLMYLPFLYALLLFMAYENATVGLQFKFKGSPLRHYAVLRAIIVFGGNLELLARFKRSMNLADELSRSSIDSALDEIWRTYRREKNPRQIPWENGWSPFTAQRFLEAHGLKTNDYHRFVHDWLADSPTIDVDDSLFPSRITYRIYGNEDVATLLKLSLDINQIGEPGTGDDRFWDISKQLLKETLGRDAVETFQRELEGRNDGKFKSKGATVALRRDDWGIKDRGGYTRELTIRHPAHVPGVNG